MWRNIVSVVFWLALVFGGGDKVVFKKWLFDYSSPMNCSFFAIYLRGQFFFFLWIKDLLCWRSLSTQQCAHLKAQQKRTQLVSHTWDAPIFLFESTVSTHNMFSGVNDSYPKFDCLHNYIIWLFLSEFFVTLDDKFSSKVFEPRKYQVEFTRILLWIVRLPHAKQAKKRDFWRVASEGRAIIERW